MAETTVQMENRELLSLPSYGGNVTTSQPSGTEDKCNRAAAL